MSPRATRIFALGLMLVVAVGLLIKIRTDAHQLDRLRGQGQMGIEKVEIHDGDGHLLATVTDPEALTTFGKLCRAAESPRSGRPAPGGQVFELSIHSRDPIDLRGTTDVRHPDEIQGVFLDRGEQMTGMHGAWRSAHFVAWIAQHTPPR